MAAPVTVQCRTRVTRQADVPAGFHQRFGGAKQVPDAADMGDVRLGGGEVFCEHRRGGGDFRRHGRHPIRQRRAIRRAQAIGFGLDELGGGAGGGKLGQDWRDAALGEPGSLQRVAEIKPQQCRAKERFCR